MEEMHGRPDAHLMRMGMLSAAAIALHNFPEGIATFVAALDNPRVGASIAAAVAIHNIPEGIAVAVPVFYATGSRARAFAWSFLSGLSEPLGALVAWWLLGGLAAPPCAASSSPAWPASWCSSPWTSFCRRPASTASTTWPCTGSSPGWQ